jgi:membrane protein
VVATALGVVTLLFGASGVFGELQGALNAVWHVKPKPRRGLWGFVRDRFLSFGMVLAVGFLLLVTLVVSTALTALGGHLEGLVPGLPVLLGSVNFAAG